MLYRVLILYIIVFTLIDINNSKQKYTVNVGTVLFSESDYHKQCWSYEQILLLRSRIIFQDVLPSIHVVNIENDKFVLLLIKYFRLAVDKVKRMSTGRTRHIQLMALGDAIGGYMHHLLLPLVKNAFYMGDISYESVEIMYDAYSELKLFLKTDGNSWAPPIKTHPLSERYIKPLPEVKNTDSTDHCKNLIYQSYPNGSMHIPMPFFDSKVEPTSMALPFKKHSLRNIKSGGSAFILAMYYTKVLSCLSQKGPSEADRYKFFKEFDEFLSDNVLYLLEDEAVYPAFGSVYRIKESINKTKPIRQKLEQAGGPGPENAEPENVTVTVTVNKTGNHTVQPDTEEHSSVIVFFGLVCVIVIWIFAAILFCCCRGRRKKKKKEHNKSSTKSKKSRLSSKSKERKAFMVQEIKTPLLTPVHGTTLKLESPKIETSTLKSSVHSEKKKNYYIGQQTSSTTKESSEKPVVFGYDFETSSSDSSSKDYSSEITVTRTSQNKKN